MKNVQAPHPRRWKPVLFVSNWNTTVGPSTPETLFVGASRSMLASTCSESTVLDGGTQLKEELDGTGGEDAPLC